MKTKDSGQRGEIWPVAERGGGGRRMINSHAGRESRFPVAPVIMSFLNYLRRPPGLDAVIRRNEPFTEASEFSDSLSLFRVFLYAKGVLERWEEI